MAIAVGRSNAPSARLSECASATLRGVRNVTNEFKRAKMTYQFIDDEPLETSSHIMKELKMSFDTHWKALCATPHYENLFKEDRTVAELFYQFGVADTTERLHNAIDIIVREADNYVSSIPKPKDTTDEQHPNESADQRGDSPTQADG